MSSDAMCQVFVGGISWKADENSLANFFSSYGQVASVRIIMDRETGKSKGYGFVTFADAGAAEEVKKLGNVNFMGKMMNIGDAVRRTGVTADKAPTHRVGPSFNAPAQPATAYSQPLATDSSYGGAYGSSYAYQGPGAYGAAAGSAAGGAGVAQQGPPGGGYHGYYAQTASQQHTDPYFNQYGYGQTSGASGQQAAGDYQAPPAYHHPGGYGYTGAAAAFQQPMPSYQQPHSQHQQAYGSSSAAAPRS
mmetsp:Transcript_15628/g.26965  ORF Transcript_15628/g.26965 Transcript_15628/m.26965 type:complete len:248 (-) Transcript_15628:599-1342(-)